jgi:hypothetical protein
VRPPLVAPAPVSPAPGTLDAQMAAMQARQAGSAGAGLVQPAAFDPDLGR